MKGKVLLIDPPTLPKGTAALSLPAVAAALNQKYEIAYLDLNFSDDQRKFDNMEFNDFIFVGLKVSAQNFSIAQQLTRQIKSKAPSVIIVWGGEIPSLMPEACLQHADTLISGLFEPVASSFISDLKSGNLQRQYSGKNNPEAGFLQPDFSILRDFSRYNTFMGLPMETSRGCPEVCTFCMVLVMQQKHYHLKPLEQLKEEIQAYSGKFINIVDYNFGVNPEHVIKVAGIIEASGPLGWMAEMNIELLDNDRMLLAMKQSRCRMIYCGLESVDEGALDSVNKAGTNKVANYERLIRKVQSYGISIAAGVIIGLDHADAASYRRTIDFYSRMGLVYAKLTFLTFNPGTRIKKYMEKQGDFISEEIDLYDGTHLTYLPKGITKEELYEITEWLINHFYSFPSMVKRALNGPEGILQKAEFLIFNLCYRNAYREWLRFHIFQKSDNFKELLRTPYVKPMGLKVAENLLGFIRKIRMKEYIPRNPAKNYQRAKDEVSVIHHA